ncbi:MAG: MFS transporter [Pseudorhodoplanes sp.]
MNPPGSQPQPASNLAALGWVRPLIATLALQTTGSYLCWIVPSIAPALATDFDIRKTAIGHFGAVTTAGAMIFLFIGSPLIKRYGPILVLQLGLVIGVLSLLTMLAPHWVFVALASLVIGLGYGPSAQAANEVLQHTAPPQHRSLIFSIKQAGVPLGGVIAGLALPPLVDAFGWQSTLLFSLFLVAATIAAVEPLRARIDSFRNPDYPADLRTLLSVKNIVSPVIALRANPAARRLALTGALLAFVPAVWMTFIVTYAVTELRMSLAHGGFLLAVSWTTGILGRLVLGYLSDRLGSGILALGLITVTSVAGTLLLGLTNTGWPFWSVLVLVIFAGLVITGWNGIVLSEIARHAPPERATETFAGANLLIFFGYFIAPPLFAVLVDFSGYRFSFLLLAACALAAGWPLLQMWRDR